MPAGNQKGETQKEAGDVAAVITRCHIQRSRSAQKATEAAREDVAIIVFDSRTTRYGGIGDAAVATD